jgi:hypothetical protein
MKTAGRAHYRMLTPGTYQWTLPSGTYLVDPTGTHALILRPPRTSSFPAPHGATGGATGISRGGFEARR